MRERIRMPFAWTVMPKQLHAPSAIDRDGLGPFRRGYCALVVLASVLQLGVFHDSDNWACVLVAAVSSIIGLLYSLDNSRFQASPVSCLMLMFYTTTATAGALLVKTLEWTALVERLQVPMTTFTVLFMSQLVLIAAHALYLKVSQLQGLRAMISRRIYNPLGLFNWPTNTEFWLLGALGCFALAMTGTDYESGASFGMGSAGEKLLRAFQFLKFAPFLIPFRDALSGTPSPPPRSYVPLGAFFGFLVLLSFATNSRSTFADSLPTIGICVLIAISYNAFSLRNVPVWKMVVAVFGAVFLAFFLTRVALAMVVVRDYRSNLDVWGLVQLTMEALTNSEWLESAKSKMTAVVTIGNYSEEYVSSGFLARYLLTKYHDNMLYYFSFFGPDHITSYTDFLVDRLWATLPDPLLSKLGIQINKEDLIISNGDYIIYMIDGWGLGGFKTGSMIAEVYSVFGWIFPLVLGSAAILMFIFYDAMVVDARHGRKVIAPLILLLIWNLCGTTAAFGFGAETIAAVPPGIVRNLPQNVVFYFIGLAAVRPLGRLLAGSR